MSGANAAAACEDDLRKWVDPPTKEHWMLGDAVVQLQNLEKGAATQHRCGEKKKQDYE